MLLGGGWNAMNGFARHGDLNGEANEDLLARDRTGTLWLYPGNGHGSFRNRVLVGTGGWDHFSSLVSVGNVSDDVATYVPDLLAKSDDELDTYPGTGRGTFGDRRQDFNWQLSDVL
uniref:Uncharacterized protein n=1 Tax=Streptomyces sp. NBC_00003 TaxID=2903608 RepID=A0AAU2VF15_9ACTN